MGYAQAAPEQLLTHLIESYGRITAREMEKNLARNVMSAASEAEIGAFFHNGQEEANIRQILKELGREQLHPTRMTTDNSTADGFANSRTKIRRSKASDMRFYWVQDRVQTGEFAIHWLKGSKTWLSPNTPPLPVTSKCNDQE
jgi:hypothetical protein